MTPDDLLQKITQTLKDFPGSARILVVEKNWPCRRYLMEGFASLTAGRIRRAEGIITLNDGSVVRFFDHDDNPDLLAGLTFHHAIINGEWKDDLKHRVQTCLRIAK